MNFPIGTIILWSSSTIPDGWQICDGSNGTPNLIDKMVMGCANDDELLDTGGDTSHSHTFNSQSTNGGGNHYHEYNINSKITNNNFTTVANPGIEVSIKHNHTIKIKTNTVYNHTHTVGTINSADNLPPYIKLIYIMRIA